MPAAKDLGQKWTCFKCATKFYDLKKPAAVCPKCGADQKEAPTKAPPASEGRSKKAAALREVPVPEPAAAEEDEADETEGEEPPEDEAEKEEPDEE